ncbi:MAG: ABC transporter substrate-binding protein [Chlamydiota bacterium]|nr:ABC transporter substrate-binding protein [Chlamydiota bacterium]
MKIKILAIFLIGFVLCSCAKQNEPDSRTTLTIAAGATAIETELLREQIGIFEKENPGIQVKLLALPPSSSQQHDVFVTYLSAKNSTIDVFNLDIIWIAEFSAAGWLAPLEPYWASIDRQDFLKGTMDACTYHGLLYAVPWFSSCGLLYSRIDVLNRFGFEVPKTWDELKNIVRQIQSQEPQWAGFVWQGAQYEGLACNFYEAYWANGNYKSTLQRMHESISENISPRSVLSYKEEDARRVFMDGKALFMRNWPYVWSIIQNNPDLKDKVALSPLCWGDNPQHGVSCLGGWNLAISRYSKHPDLAWKLVAFLTAKNQMREKCLRTSEFPTRKSLLEDAKIQGHNPYWDKIHEVLLNARSRPTTPFYSDWSLKLQFEVSKSLSDPSAPYDHIADILKLKWKEIMDLEEKGQ